MGVSRLVRYAASAAILLTTGCASYIQNYAESRCSKRFAPDDSAYADCVNWEIQQQYAGIRSANQSFQQSMEQQRQQNRQAYEGAYPAFNQPVAPAQPIPPPAPVMSNGLLRSSYVSGLNRICIYDKLGSQNVVTIPALEFCPLN